MTITITGLTADRMLDIEAASVTGGEVVGDDLILIRHDGAEINAGNVRGPEGPPFVNGVDTVSNQSISGLKTFTKKVVIQNTVSGVALRIGTGANTDPLNISVFGAAAANLSSGADYDGATSTARATSATQLEFLNDSISLFANTGLTNGVSYTRTKIVDIDSTGQLNIRRPTAGLSLYISKEASTMGAGSVIINRLDATKSESIVFSGGTAVNMVIGRQVGSDHLDAGYDGGAGFVHTFRFGTGGDFRAVGSASYFGSGAIGSVDNTAVSIGHYDPDYGLITVAQPVRSNAHLIIQSKGTGSLLFRNGANPGFNMALDASGKLTVNMAGGAGFNSDTVEFYGSPNTGYAGVRIRSGWGSGGGGVPLLVSNAVSTLMQVNNAGGVESQGEFSSFGSGAFGGTGAYFHLQGTATEGYLRVFGSPTNIPMILRPKGISYIYLQGGAGETFITGGGNGSVPLLSFFGASPIARPTVIGTVDIGEDALASLIYALSQLGLVIDGTT